MAEETKIEIKETQPEKKELEDFPERYIFKQVKSIVFGVLSPKMIKKMAVAKIVTPELYDKEGYPVDGGLMDTRMGVIDPGLTCRTDGKKLKETPGYFGYIELARPVIHIKFVNLIHSLVASTCRECGRVLVPQSKISKVKSDLDKIEEEAGSEARREHIRKLITATKTVNKCPHCKAKQHK